MTIEEHLTEARRKVPSCSVTVRVPRGAVKCLRDVASTLFLFKGGGMDEWETCRAMLLALDNGKILDPYKVLSAETQEDLAL